MHTSTFRLKKYVLFGGDIIILYLSLYAALALRYYQLPDELLWQAHLWPFSVIFIVWLIVFYISNLYELTLAANNARFFTLTAQALIINFLLGAAFFYLNPYISIAPKTNLLLTVVIAAVLFTLWRQLYNALLKSYLPKNNIAIIGLNNQARELIKRFADYPHLGIRVACVIHTGATSDQRLYDVPVYEDMQNFRELFETKKVSIAVVADDLQNSNDLRAHLFSTLRLGIQFISLSHFYEKIMGKVPVSSLTQMWFLENLNEAGKLWFDKLKRVYDLIGALLILVVTLPFWPFIAVIITLESRGPVFYRQERLGKNNAVLKIYKFRSMVEEGNTRHMTVPHDPRVTRFGKFMRQTRIDEIPQVLNVLTGEMSFIGPRPERPDLAEKLAREIPFYNERMLVLPGITGWAQVSEYHSPSIEDTIKKLQYDLFYVKNRSLFLDLVIALRTVRTILTHGGV